ncbi:unnamed protein product, partial [marine sediment metagenome]
TLNGARSMGIDKHYGSIEADKVANFVVLNANPEKDIVNTKEIYMVFKDGKPWQ